MLFVLWLCFFTYCKDMKRKVQTAESFNSQVFVQTATTTQGQRKCDFFKQGCKNTIRCSIRGNRETKMAKSDK